MYDLAHGSGWEPYDLHDLVCVSWVGCVLQCTDPARHPMSIGSELDYLCRDLRRCLPNKYVSASPRCFRGHVLCCAFRSDRDRSEPSGGDVVGAKAVRGGVFSGPVLGPGPRASGRGYVTGIYHITGLWWMTYRMFRYIKMLN